MTPRNLLVGLALLAHSVLAQPQTYRTRTAPRPQGNTVDISLQTAPYTLQLDQLPGNVPPNTNRFLLYQGPIMTTDRQKLFTNGGITSIALPDVANAMRLPTKQRHLFPGGNALYDIAKGLADRLPNRDPRKKSLSTYGYGQNNHHYADYNLDAWKLLGKQFYLSVVGSGPPPAFFGADIEGHEDGPGTPDAGQYLISGFYAGAREAIAERGDPTQLYTYGSGTLSEIVNYTNNRQDDDYYFRIIPPAWRGANGVVDMQGALSAPFRAGAFVGGDKYQRRTWDDATLFSKNPDGSIRNTGKYNDSWFYGKRTGVSNYGYAGFETYRWEAKYFVEMQYEEADKLLNEWRLRCNTPTTTYNGNTITGGYRGNFMTMPFPRGTIDLRPGMEKVKTISFFRDNTEIEQMYDPLTGTSDPYYTTPEICIVAANQRPLNPDAIEMTVLARTVLNDALYIWSSNGNYGDWVQGRNGQHPFDFSWCGGQRNYSIRQPFGQFETMLKASQRGRSFPELFRVMDSGKAMFVLPWRFVVRGNQQLGERELDKPIFWGIKEAGGRRMWAFWCLPAQDKHNPAHERDLTMWIQLPNGKQSPAYAMRLANRQTGFDEFLLPNGFETAQPEDFRFKFTGLLGGDFYRTGNYNVPVSGRPSVPGVATSQPATYTLPATR